MSSRKDRMVFNDKLTSNEEMMVIEGLCLTNASEDGNALFKKIIILGEDTLICMN